MVSGGVDRERDGRGRGAAACVAGMLKEILVGEFAGRRHFGR
jgi:hypothetical protein